jgi:hypothetical protein
MQSYRQERPIVTVRARQRIHCRNLYINFHNKTIIKGGTGKDSIKTSIVAIEVLKVEAQTALFKDPVRTAL